MHGHKIGVMQDQVYLRPYRARITDIDMGESGVWMPARQSKSGTEDGGPEEARLETSQSRLE